MTKLRAIVFKILYIYAFMVLSQGNLLIVASIAEYITVRLIWEGNKEDIMEYTVCKLHCN